MTEEDLHQFAGNLFLPPPRMEAWEWCEKHVVLPPTTTNRPGPWRSEVTPYVRGILSAVADPRITTVIMAWASQTSKTQAIICAAMHQFENNPQNCVWMMPSTDLSKSFSKTRLDPIIKACEPVRAKLSDNRGDDNILEKIFSTHVLALVGGNSAANLASRPAGFLIADEIDKLEVALTRESCPVVLLLNRAKTYGGRRKIILASTPTTRDHKIWPRLEEGSYEKLYWPCPHCGEGFVPTWKSVKWPKDDGMDDVTRSKAAWIECPHCLGKFVDRHKRKALLAAEWRATNPLAPSEIRSFHLSEIQSPFTPLSELVLKFIRATEKAKRGDMGELKDFINSSLAEPWEDGQFFKRTPEELRALVDQRPRGLAPRKVCGLTFGADTQDNGFWYLIRAWGEMGESWLVQEGFAPNLEVLESIVINGRFSIAGGPEIQTSFGLIDAGGHRTDEVRKWCLRFPGRVMPSFGRQRMTKVYTITPVDDNVFGGQEQVFLDTNFLKNAIMAKTKINCDDPGAFHVHADTSADWFEHMTAEFIDEKTGLWTCPKHADNHLFDCEVYAAGASYMVGLWEVKPEAANQWRTHEQVAPAAAPRRKEEGTLW